MTDPSYWGLIAALVGTILGIGSSYRMGQIPKLSLTSQTRFKYGFLAVIGGTIFPAVTFWFMTGIYWALLVFVFLAGLERAVYALERRRLERKTERMVAFDLAHRDNTDREEAPFGSYRL